MGIPLWKSILFFAGIALLGINLFPSQRELGFLYTQSHLFDRAQFYLARQYQEDPRDEANAVRYLEALLHDSDRESLARIASGMMRQFPSSPALREIAAEGYQQNMEMDKAAALWMESLQLGSENREIFYNLENYGLTEKKWDLLVRFYDFLKKQHPSDTRVLLMQARFLMLMRRLEEAEKVFHQVLNREPSNPEAKIRLAQILAFRQDWEGEMGFYRRLMRESPDRSDYVYLLVERLEGLGRFEESAQVYESVLANFSSEYDFLRRAADALIRAGHKPRALELMEKLRASERQDSELSLALAGLYFEMREYRKALLLLEDDHEKNGGTSRSYHLLGDVWTALGDRTAGQRAYEQALQLLRSRRD